MSAELNELRDSARQVVSGIGLAAGEQSSWAQIAELGWLMVSTPEELGGLGMGPAAAGALHLELGRGLATVPFLSQTLAIDALARSAFAARENWLESMMTGERQVSASLAEANFTAAGSDGAYQINGWATAVPSADQASHVLVEAEGDHCVALVALEQSEVEVIPRPTWDKTRRLFDVEIADLTLDSESVIASGEAAILLGQRVSIQRDLALAADAVGGALALLEMTVEYLQTRQQFGRPLALFQALKHRCADLKAMTEAAQALLLSSLNQVEDPAGDLQVTAAAEMQGMAAKQLACSTFAWVAEEALQLHGGIGMTEEHDCHLFLKRALLNEHLGRRQDSYDKGLADRYLNGLA